VMPDVKVAANYRERFRSSDGQTRAFVVEGAGGPSWYTEYNVLTGLSVRSYGRFAESVTRLAAGRVKRGLPYALRECGYNTYSLYSWFAAFAGARGFQTSPGIEHFLDSKQLHAGPADTDIFFYDRAADVIARNRGDGPVFVFVYLAANHFPWDYHYRPDLLPNWVNPGNPFEIDEYLRRQEVGVPVFLAFQRGVWPSFPRQEFPPGAFRRPPAAVGQAVNRPDARPGRGGGAHFAARSALFHHLLRGRRGQFPARRSFIRARHARRVLSSAGGAGGGRSAARCQLLGAKENSQALPRPVLSLRRRRGGAAVQSAADRRGVDSGILKPPTIATKRRPAGGSTTRSPGLAV